MGHWAESLVDEFAQQIGGNPDRRMLTDLAAQAGREMEILSGRSFRPLRRMTSIFENQRLALRRHPGHAGRPMEIWREYGRSPTRLTPR
jgi:hypothetical protein